MVDRIDAEVSLSGQLSDDQWQRLMEIANRCPVHRTLVSEIQLGTNGT
jgi:putative redox protein